MATKTDQELISSNYPLLSAFSRLLRRESHILMRHPDLLWQLMANHLQWEGSSFHGHLSIEEELQNRPGSHPFIT